MVKNLQAFLASLFQDQKAPTTTPVKSAIHGYWDGIRDDGHRSRTPFQVADAESTHSGFSRLELISVSRRLYDNDGITSGGIDYISDHGFPLTIESDSADPEWNKAADDYFENWCENFADIKGEDTFAEIQAQLSIDIDKDGDTLPIFTRHPSGIPAIQVIEAHRIDHSGLTGSRWNEGIWRNAQYRATHYAITERGRSKPRVIPAFSAMHLFNRDRAKQNRGLPALRRAIVHRKDMREILGFEKLTVKNLSSILPYIESDTGAITGADYGIDKPDLPDDNLVTESETKKTANAFPVQTIFGNEVQTLKPNEQLKTIDFNRPSQTFQGFLNHLMREFSLGLKIPYEILIDPKGITGPAHRSILKRAQKTITPRQTLIGRFCKRARTYVIADAINTGQLPAVKGWYKSTILRPAPVTIDAGREQREDREDFRAGLTTMQDIYGNKGQNWRKGIDQTKMEVKALFDAAKALEQETGMPLEWCMDRLSIITPNGIIINDTNQNSNQSD